MCPYGTEIGVTCSRDGALLIAAIHSVRVNSIVHVCGPDNSDKIIFENGKVTVTSQNTIEQETNYVEYLCTSITTRLK